MNVMCSAIIVSFFLLSAVPAFASDYFSVCADHLKSGQYDRAEGLGRQWIEESGRNAEAHFCLAEALRKKGELHRANQQMKTAEFYASKNEYLILKLALKEISPEKFQQLQNELQLKIASRLGDIALKLQDYTQALSAFQRSRTFAQELGNKAEEASAVISLAVIQSAMNEYDSALKSYKEALSLAPQDSSISLIYNNMALVYDQIGNYPAAEEYFAKSLALDVTLGDKRNQALHLLNLGKHHQIKKDYARAATYFSKSRQISRDLQDALGEGSADRALGDMYRELGNMRLSRSAYTNAREHFTKAGASNDVKHMTDQLAGMGTSSAVGLESGYIAACNENLAAGDFTRAVENGRKAVDASKRSVDANFCLADAWRQKGDLRRAQQQMQMAYVLADEYDYLAALKRAQLESSQEQHLIMQKELKLKISGRLGNIAAKLKDYDQAFVEYQRSIALAKELDNKDEEATAYANLARLYSDQGEYEQSLASFREALKLTNREAEISSLYNNMAVVYGHMGDFPVAEDYFAKSLSLDEKLGDKRAQAMHLLNLGLNYQAKQDYTAAVSIFNKSRQISRLIPDRYWEGAAERHFGDMYRALGNMRLARISYTAARDHFAAAHALGDVDSISNVIEDLAEAQPVAGIEIGSTDVSSLLFALRTDKNGGMVFKEILRQSSGAVMLKSKDGEALSSEEIESIASGVAAASKMLLEERNLNRSVVSVMVTGVPAAARNRVELTNRIKQESGIAPIFMSAAEQARYEFSGSLSPGKEADGLLLNVSADATTISALGSDNSVVSKVVAQGAFTAIRQQGKRPKNDVEKTINGLQAASIRQVFTKNPGFASRKSVYLAGDVARVVAVLTSPDKDGNLVKITTADLDKFIKAVKKKHSPYFNPNLKKIKDPEVQLWAEGQLFWLKQNFVPDDLMAGVQYLKMLMTELKVKEAYVSRGGSWLTGRLFETVRMAEKLDTGKK